MISYIDEFEELIAGMDSGQGYIQNFVDGLSDLRIKNIILVRWNEGSIRTISEAFDLAMEKETSYSNLAGSGDELLLMTSVGVSDVIIQRISNAVCENMKQGHDGKYDLSCGFDSIPTNFLKNCQYGSQGNFTPGNNTRSNNDSSSGNNMHFNSDFPSGNNARFNNNFPPGSNTRFHSDSKGYSPHTEPNHGPFGGDRQSDSYNGGNLGLSHGEAEGASTWPDLMAEDSPDPTARGKIPTMMGIRRTNQVTRNSIVRSPWDMTQRLVPTQVLMRHR